jgi:pyridoxine 5-phosphate synthase
VRLSVKLDHIATLREARRAREPEPVAAAVLAEIAGADGITVHLRGDRRHIKERDVELLRQIVSRKLSVEVAANSEMVRIVSHIRPDQVTLVPERPQEITTEGGLDVALHAAALKGPVRQLQHAGIRVAILVDPHPEQVRKARSVGADAVEINLAPYAAAAAAERRARLAEIQDAARLAVRQDLEVLGGHGLTYANVRPIAAVAGIAELSVGHGIVTRSLVVGMERAVREMVAILQDGRAS